MANASIAPVLIQAKVAQRIKSKAWMNRYACASCGAERVTEPSSAQKHPTCSKCATSLARTVRQSRSKYYHRHPLYSVRQHMIERCTKPSNHNFHRYGGRGIDVCSEWMNDPYSFIAWGISNGWKPGLELDRIDNNGGYCPANCRFATQQENTQNRSTARLDADCVRAIRMLSWSGLPNRYIAKIFDIASGDVSRIMRFKRWSNV